MQNISYYPHTTKRTARVIYLSFYILAGISIIAFPFLYQNGFFSLLSFSFYISWGFSLIIGASLMFLPRFYQRVYISINSIGIFYRIHFLLKSKKHLWKDISAIKLKEDTIEIACTNKNFVVIPLNKIGKNAKNEIKKAISENTKKTI